MNERGTRQAKNKIKNSDREYRKKKKLDGVDDKVTW